MKRTNVFELIPTKKIDKILQELLVRSSAVYNLSNYRKRQTFFQNQKEGSKKLIPSAYSLQKELKEMDTYRQLGAGYSQQIIAKNQEAWNSYFQLIKSAKVKHKVNLPKYYKNRRTNTTLPHILVCRNDLYSTSQHYIKISIPKDLKKKYGIKQMLKIPYNGVPRWRGKQGKAEIKYDLVKKKYYFFQSVTIPDPVKKSGSVVGVDLGVRNALTATTGKKTIKLSTDKLYKKYMTISGRIERYQSILAQDWKTKEGKPTRYTSRKICLLFQKRKRIQAHAMNCYVKDLISFCKQNGVAELAVGNVKHIRNSVTKSKTVNRMIHNFWSYGILTQKLRNKCEEAGFSFNLVNEMYTSQQCPECTHCDKQNRKTQQEFVCTNCSYRNHADIVGATNILLRHTGGDTSAVGVS